MRVKEEFGRKTFLYVRIPASGMKELIEKICKEAGVSPDQAKTILLILQQYIKSKHRMFSSAINKAFGGLDGVIEEFKKENRKRKFSEDSPESVMNDND